MTRWLQQDAPTRRKLSIAFGSMGLLAAAVAASAGWNRARAAAAAPSGGAEFLRAAPTGTAETGFWAAALRRSADDAAPLRPTPPAPEVAATRGDQNWKDF